MKNKTDILFQATLTILISIAVIDIVSCYVLENNPLVPLILAISMLVVPLIPVPFLITFIQEALKE